MKKQLLVGCLAALFTAILCGSPADAQEKKKPDLDAQFKRLDKNGDGKLSLEEFKGNRTGEKAEKAETQFKRMDKNNDGFLTLEEFKNRGKKKSN